MRRRRILLLFSAFLVLLLLGTWFVLRQTGATRTFVQRVLQQFIRSEFALADADLDPASGTVRLSDVRIDHPSPGVEPVLRASAVELDVNTNPLGSGAIGDVRAVRLTGLTLDLTLDGTLDIGEILDLPELEQGEGAGDLPAIRIEESVVRLRRSATTKPVKFVDVALELIPEQDSPSRVVLKGSMRSANRGYEVTVRGGGDMAANTFRALLEGSSVELNPEFARPFSDEVADYLAKTEFSGRADKVTLWVEYDQRSARGDDVETPGSDAVPGLRAGANVEVASLSMNPPELGGRIEQAAGKLSASTRGGGTIGADLTAKVHGAEVAVQAVALECASGSTPVIDARVDATGVPISRGLEGALARFPLTAKILAAFSPSGGTVDTSLHLRNSKPGDPLAADLDLTLHEVDLSFDGFGDASDPTAIRFPYPLIGATGEIQLRRGKVYARNIAAKTEGDGTVRIQGEVEPRADAASGLDLDIRCAGLTCSARLRRSLADLEPEIVKHYDDYSPSGQFDCRVKILRAAGSAEVDPTVDVTIEPRGVSAMFRGFPYRVDDLRGRIQIANQDVAIDLSARHGSTRATALGRVRRRDHPDLPGLEVRLRVDETKLDEELHRAVAQLAPQLDPIWQEYRPTGTIRTDLTLWRPAGSEEPSYDLRVDLLDTEVRAKRLQRSVRNLRGPLFVHGDGNRARVELSGLRGELMPLSTMQPTKREATEAESRAARFLIQGLAFVDGEGARVDWTAVVRGLELNDELAVTLDSIGALERAAWTVLAPSGSVDVIFREYQAKPSDPAATTLQLQLIDVGSDAAFLPGPLRNVHGLVTIRDGTAGIENLRGKIRGAVVDCRSATVRRADGRTRFTAELAAESFPVDDSLANLMTGPMKETFLARKMRGHAAVDDLKIDYTFPDGETDGFSLQFSGKFTPRDVSLELAAPIRNLSGTWQIAEGTRFTTNGGKLSGTAEGVRFTVLGHRVSNFSARLSATPQAVTFRDTNLQLHGGQIVGEPEDGVAIRYEFAQRGKLTGHVRWRGVRLDELIRASGQRMNEYRGTLNGTARLDELVGDDLIRMKASATLEIRDGKLGEVPAFSAIYAQLSPKKRPQFDTASMGLEIADGRIAVNDLEVSSPVLKVVGSGSITMDGYLDMVIEFPDLFGSGANWLVLPQVLKAIGNQVVQFYVYGYARAPKARPRWLWQGTPSRSPIEPIPAQAPRRVKKKF